MFLPHQFPILNIKAQLLPHTDLQFPNAHIFFYVQFVQVQYIINRAYVELATFFSSNIHVAAHSLTFCKLTQANFTNF